MQKNDLTEIVIVDQDEDFTQKFKQELKDSEKLQCIATANDGHSGLELIVEKDPDHVVIDLILPHMDGLSILDRLQEKNKINELNIIVLSSFLNEQMIKLLQNYEIDYFMSKPIDLDCVKRRIKDIDQNYDLKQYSQKVKEQSAEENKNVILNLEITNLLDEFGVPANIRGYLYLRNAIFLSISDLNLVNSITKKLYPEIAVKFETESNRVERAIRHAIKVAWERGNQRKIAEYFGYSISETIGRPTNAQFIAKVADNFRLKNNMIIN
ncbi:MAG: sporulation transcription factor Spo0A [Halanaerobiales bacterium]|nr:sporulation transcription factor Spo0A [Halanaerobiales bacterium]